MNRVLIGPLLSLSNAPAFVRASVLDQELP
jgi:hypothetical protein